MQTKLNQHPLALARDLLDETLTKQDWLDTFAEMRRIALHAENTQHRINAARFLCEYRFGKPATVVEYTQDPPSPTEQFAPLVCYPMPHPDSPEYPEAWAKTIFADDDDDDRDAEPIGDAEHPPAAEDALSTIPNIPSARQAQLASPVAVPDLAPPPRALNR